VSDDDPDGPPPIESNTTNWIPRPAFHDFFDETFLGTIKNAEGYKHLNNATEIAAALDLDEENRKKDSSIPIPLYRPRKIIPLTPAMVKKILEQGDANNFNAIIDGIREYAWHKIKSFRKRETVMDYLRYIYYTLQAFWAHGNCPQPGEELLANQKFLHCDPGSFAKIT
jgi:hypothetical protein